MPVASEPNGLLVMLPVLLGAVLAALCLGFALRARRRARLVTDLPTSKTTGVFIGLVEVQGTAEVETPLTSFLTESPCVYHTWQVTERWSKTVTRTDSKGRTSTHTESGWRTVASGGEQCDFYLQDDQGVLLVRPEGATIEAASMLDETCGPSDPLYYGKGPPGAIMHSDMRRRFTESVVRLHAPLYVMGQARERVDTVAAELAADPRAPMYLISTHTEGEVQRGLGWHYWLLALLGLVLAVGGVFGCLALGRAQAAPIAVPLLVLAGLGYLLAWILGWLLITFNSLVELRQRVHQAWANVDVQLQRRHDLIPSLVAAVSGLRDYERQAQGALALLRAQLGATAPGEPGVDPAGCAPALRAVVEAYPELKADASFLQLQQQLSDTEQRLALARGYFNDLATAYNTRLEIIPDRYIAGLVRMQSRALLMATDFERAPVTVKFAQ